MADTPPPARRRLPPWLRKRIPCGTGGTVRTLLEDLRLNTVCRSARCPNATECFGKNRATFLIMGPHCTRRCTFCAVAQEAPVPLDPTEPERVAEAVTRLELRHAVITSVTRDDLADGGAGHFAATITAIRHRHPCTIEVLTPDFQGQEDAVATVVAAGPDIFNHNIETVPRLYPTVRPEADYARSLALFDRLSRTAPGLLTKSGLMLGLGEADDEVRSVLADLREAGCQILTLGQYLAPTTRHHPVAAYIEPERFAAWKTEAEALGFRHVAAAPFVRSSYNAEEVLAAAHQTPSGEAPA